MKGTDRQTERKAQTNGHKKKVRQMETHTDAQSKSKIDRCTGTQRLNLASTERHTDTKQIRTDTNTHTHTDRCADREIKI